MTTKQQILDDFTKAFKERNELRKSVLSDIKAEILVKEKAPESSGEVNSEALAVILKMMVKRRKDSIEAYTAGNRADLASKEKAELEVLEEYLPEMMAREQVTAVIKKIVSENNFTPADFGRAMGAVMTELKGQADGGVVSEVLKEVLAK
ncbi:MAG: GatB/YqeY domain-containing protein [bacterium]|nr:GatB/YqeY domain-containing protein [bacterium]